MESGLPRACGPRNDEQLPQVDVEGLLEQIRRNVELIAEANGLQVFEVLAWVTVRLLAPHCEKEEGGA